MTNMNPIGPFFKQIDSELVSFKTIELGEKFYFNGIPLKKIGDKCAITIFSQEDVPYVLEADDLVRVKKTSNFEINNYEYSFNEDMFAILKMFTEFNLDKLALNFNLSGENA